MKPNHFYCASAIFATMCYVSNTQLDSNMEYHVWLKAFKKRRIEQTTAIDEVLKINDPKKLDRVLDTLIKTVVPVLHESEKQLITASFEPGKQFPQEDHIKDALSRTIENAAFLSELTLRLPNHFQSIFKVNHELLNVFKWSVDFSLSTGFCDSITSSLFNLLDQEMNFVPRDESYMNPYDLKAKEDASAQMILEATKKLKKKKKSCQEE